MRRWSSASEIMGMACGMDRSGERAGIEQATTAWGWRALKRVDCNLRLGKAGPPCTTRPASAPHLTDAERIDRLRLIRSDNIGPRTRSLLQHFGDAATALERLPDLARRGGATRPGRRVAAMTMRAPSSPRAGRPASAWSRPKKPVIRRASPRSTTLPPLLGIRGAPDRADATDDRDRRLTPAASGAGLKFAGTIARDLGEAGFVVISGLRAASIRPRTAPALIPAP